MEKQIEMKGQDFAKCQSCPYLLSFNWQKSKGRDVVHVVCRVEQCVKSEVSVQAEKAEAEVK